MCRGGRAGDQITWQRRLKPVLRRWKDQGNCLGAQALRDRRHNPFADLSSRRLSRDDWPWACFCPVCLYTGASMAHRDFTDSIGRHWDVWTVVPAFAERRRVAPAKPPAPDRRRRDASRVPLGSQWANGWLAFSTVGESRRLALYPATWPEMSPEELEALCGRAVPSPRRRRLIE